MSNYKLKRKIPLYHTKGEVNGIGEIQDMRSDKKYLNNILSNNVEESQIMAYYFLLFFRYREGLRGLVIGTIFSYKIKNN